MKISDTLCAGVVGVVCLVIAGTAPATAETRVCVDPNTPGGAVPGGQVANGANAVACGAGATATGANSVAIGNGARATDPFNLPEGAVAIGAKTFAGPSATAIGNGSQATDIASVAIGGGKADGSTGIAIGNGGISQ
jgi:hypothetical protein